jgi:hypothetical protein
MVEKWSLRACRPRDATEFYSCCDQQGSDLAVRNAISRPIECIAIIGAV